MERLCQALMTLTLVVPALAVPGLMPIALQQQPMNQQPIDMAIDPLKHHRRPQRTTSTVVSQSATMSPSPMSTEEVTTATFSPTELLKRKSKPKPENIPCTPGDRYCHASLSNVLFCTDDRQWVTYAQCSQGTICHRLHMVCVTEAEPTDTPEPSLPSQPVDDTSFNQCKEGDRRCSGTFNRVDRCNSNREWVTYHDCHLSEECDDDLLDCLPQRIPYANDMISNVTVTPNGTAITPMKSVS
ncbi:hypothetical protein F4680DRAFT_468184 [Xylaria scruposa]|nr:hypothetical protein F4680DRAFT_468184 [Xylaria scruposa]